MDTYIHLVSHGHRGNAWRQWLAGVGIVVLAGFGLYFAISNLRQGEIALGLWVLGALAGTATVYGFGYFWCLPDVLGGTSCDALRTLRQRWSDFALLSTFIALCVIEAAYARAIWANWPYVDLARALAILLACSWLLMACVVASEKYLGWTLPDGQAQRGAGWKRRVRRGMWKWGNWLVTLLGLRGSLAIGGALSLLSLSLVIRGEIFGPDYKGLQIIAGRGTWLFADAGDTSSVGVWLALMYRGAYLLGLVVASLALAAVALGRWGRNIRTSRILKTLAGVIALLEITSIAVTMAFVDHESLPSLWRLLWIIPVVIWLWGAHRGGESWDRTRLAVMVFYLPIFFLGLAFLVFLTYQSAAIGAFIGGTLLVWWGLVQSGWEAGHGEDSRRPEVLEAPRQTGGPL